MLNRRFTFVILRYLA